MHRTLATNSEGNHASVVDLHSFFQNLSEPRRFAKTGSNPSPICRRETRSGQADLRRQRATLTRKELFDSVWPCADRSRCAQHAKERGQERMDQTPEQNQNRTDPIHRARTHDSNQRHEILRRNQMSDMNKCLTRLRRWERWHGHKSLA